ncbi:hypothetical protein IAU60_000440 [Kwoniella sp. DSM 27419]
MAGEGQKQSLSPVTRARHKPSHIQHNAPVIHGHHASSRIASSPTAATSDGVRLPHAQFRQSAGLDPRYAADYYHAAISSAGPSRGFPGGSSRGRIGYAERDDGPYSPSSSRPYPTRVSHHTAVYPPPPKSSPLYNFFPSDMAGRPPFETRPMRSGRGPPYDDDIGRPGLQRPLATYPHTLDMNAPHEGAAPTRPVASSSSSSSFLDYPLSRQRQRSDPISSVIVRTTSRESERSGQSNTRQRDASGCSSAGESSPTGLDDVIAPLSGSTSELRKKRRTRALMSNDQLAGLGRLWRTTKFPTAAEREDLGKTILLTSRQVQVWFQNQRQKTRKAIQANGGIPDGADPADYKDLSKSPHSNQYPMESEDSVSSWPADAAYASGPSQYPSRPHSLPESYGVYRSLEATKQNAASYSDREDPGYRRPYASGSIYGQGSHEDIRAAKRRRSTSPSFADASRQSPSSSSSWAHDQARGPVTRHSYLPPALARLALNGPIDGGQQGRDLPMISRPASPEVDGELPRSPPDAAPRTSSLSSLLD